VSARTVRHRRLRFELDVPEALDAELDAGALALVARAPAPDVAGGFHANLVVAAQALGDGPDDGDVAARTDRALAAHALELSNVHLLDRDDAWVGGVPGVRTLLHHNAGGRAVVVEQWRLVRDGLGWELSASCPALDYPTIGARLALAAESIRFR
jgi:hypothetical protein